MRLRVLFLAAGIWALGVGAINARAEWVDLAEQAAGTVPNYSANPFVALERGAGVYLTTIEKIDPAEKPAGGPGQNANDMAKYRTSGRITLQVADALSGEKINKLNLPYDYWIQEPPIHSNWAPTLWPKVEEMKAGQALLCVVLPGPFRSDSGEAGEARAACAVYGVSGPDDPMVQAYRKMVKLHAMRGGELTAAALAAAGDTSAVLRAYLASAAVYQLQRADGVKLARSLTDVYAQPGMPASRIGISELALIGQRENTSESLRAQVARALVGLLGSADAQVRADARNGLYDVARKMRESARYFSPAERKHFREMILKSGPERRPWPVTDELAAWLDEGGPPIYSHLTGDFYLLKNDFWTTVHHGGGLYVASVAERRQTAGPDPATVGGITERSSGWPVFGGHLTLAMESTLAGPERKSLATDYSYHLFADDRDYWPNLDRLPKDGRLLCVVMPRLGLPTGVTSDTDLTVCTALAVKGVDDETVKAFDRMLKWDGMEGAALKEAMLKEAAASVPGAARDYLIASALNRLEAADGIEVLVQLVPWMARETRARDDFSGRGALFCMDILLGPSATSDAGLQKKVILCAAESAGANDLAMRFDALQTLEKMSREAPGEGAFLSPVLKAKIHEAIVQMNGSMDAVPKQRIEDWIGK